MLKIIEAKKEDRDTMMNLLEKYPNKDVDYEDGTPADVFFFEKGCFGSESFLNRESPITQSASPHVLENLRRSCHPQLDKQQF